MIIDARKYTGPEFRPFSNTGSVYSIVENMKSGETVRVTEFIDAKGNCKGYMFPRVYVAQVGKFMPERMYMTRDMKDHLMIYRIK